MNPEQFCLREMQRGDHRRMLVDDIVTKKLVLMWNVCDKK